MRYAIVIPARYASSRLPGKMLLKATGKYLVQHVYERASQAKAAAVLVATDDERILRAVKEFGGTAVSTSPHHPSGTDRVAEAARHVDADVIVNLQGDEPHIDPGHLDLLPQLLQMDSGAAMATLATPLTSLDQYQNPNCVKVVCDSLGRALYFSRSPLPYVRDGQPSLGRPPFLQHVGLYAYRRDFLLQLAELPPAPLEALEKLEQLRVLHAGHAITVGVVDHAGQGIDTQADYDAFVSACRSLAA
jgi:3-deoxy-manno-octulosonate cytidylyltransferase (CMP-KDO synthetase)